MIHVQWLRNGIVLKKVPKYRQKFFWKEEHHYTFTVQMLLICFIQFNWLWIILSPVARLIDVSKMEKKRLVKDFPIIIQRSVI